MFSEDRVRRVTGRVPFLLSEDRDRSPRRVAFVLPEKRAHSSRRVAFVLSEERVRVRGRGPFVLSEERGRRAIRRACLCSRKSSIQVLVHLHFEGEGAEAMETSLFGSARARTTSDRSASTTILPFSVAGICSLQRQFLSTPMRTATTTAAACTSRARRVGLGGW